LTSAAVAVAITLLFVFPGGVAARRIDSIAAADFSGDRIIDHVLTWVRRSRVRANRRFRGHRRGRTCLI